MKIQLESAMTESSEKLMKQAKNQDKSQLITYVYVFLGLNLKL